MLKDKILEWHKSTYATNLYGENIPTKYLEDESIVIPYAYGGYTYTKLSQIRQNGFATQRVVNDKNKTSEAEKKEYVIFTEIFHDLVKEDKLCPANFVSEVLKKLKERDMNENLCLSQDVYRGMITRAMRTFASYVRELCLEEIVEKTISTYAKKNGLQFEMLESTSEEDIKKKTDISFILDNKIYRVWSYQVTNVGVDKTSNRVMRATGEGYNILMPFDMYENKENFYGWFLYDSEKTAKSLIELVSKNDVEKYCTYRDKVLSNKYIIKNPSIFLIE